MVLLYIYIVQQSQYIYYNNIQLLFCSTTLAAVLDQYVTAAAAVVVVHHSVPVLSMMMCSTTAEAVILIIQLSPLTLLCLQYHIIVLPYTLPYITYHNLYIISRLITSLLPLLMLTECRNIILVAVMLLPLYPLLNNNTTTALQLLQLWLLITVLTM